MTSSVNESHTSHLSRGGDSDAELYQGPSPPLSSGTTATGSWRSDANHATSNAPSSPNVDRTLDPEEPLDVLAIPDTQDVINRGLVSVEIAETL